MHLIAGARGAMAEPSWLRSLKTMCALSHLVDVDKHPGALNTDAAQSSCWTSSEPI